MRIAWIYLDKRAATVEALKDYETMAFIIKNHPDDMEEARQCLTTLPCAKLSDLPARGLNPHAGETRLAATLDEIDVLKERYRRALEYMEWFRPAWDALTDDERYLLTEFYLSANDTKTQSILNICEHFHVERAWAYRKKDAALARLTVLLYGK